MKLRCELSLRDRRLGFVALEPGRQPDGASDRQGIRFRRGVLRIGDFV